MDVTGVLYATDLDATLLDKRQGVSEQDLAAIKEFTRQGGLFTIATGRSLMATESVMPLIPVNAPVILLNGALIYDTARKKPLYAEPLAPETRAVAFEVSASFPDLGLEIFTENEKFAMNRNAHIDAHLRSVRCVAADVSSPREAAGDWFKILLVDEPARLALAYTWLEDTYRGKFDICFSRDTLLEIQNRGTEKGEGLARLAKLIGAEKVFCAGDNGNDLPMMRRFPSFAPENAIPECKSAAAVCGPAHDMGFTAFALGELLNM
ncbi:MAG: HAD-IIB family hydrolase [Oscillospiraceae bacterium]|jgi:Cof subfamily protein (haloacid dehalogenase superfamily)|nr:HAD-IIB family hydrolase [Oscillospiraceae bacterium]